MLIIVDEALDDAAQSRFEEEEQLEVLNVREKNVVALCAQTPVRPLFQPPVTYFVCATGCSVHVRTCFVLASSHNHEAGQICTRIGGAAASPVNKTKKKLCGYWEAKLIPQTSSTGRVVVFVRNVLCPVSNNNNKAALVEVAGYLEAKKQLQRASLSHFYHQSDTRTKHIFDTETLTLKKSLHH